MKKKLIISVICLALIGILGVTYAFFSYTNISEVNEIITGEIYLNYEETSNIYLINAFPETKSQALTKTVEEGGVFNFSITGRNTSTYPIYYEIDLLNGEPVDGKTKVIPPEHIMIYLECDGEVLIEGESYRDWNNRRIWVDTIDAGITEDIAKKYVLRMWIRDDVIISDTDPDADYTTEEWNNSYASLKVRVIGNLEEKEVPLSILYEFDEYQLVTISKDSLPSNATIDENGNIVISNTMYKNGVGFEVRNTENEYPKIIIKDSIVYSFDGNSTDANISRKKGLGLGINSYDEIEYLIENVTFYGNSTTSDTRLSYGNGLGINIDNAGSQKMKYLTISNCTFNDINKHGIQLSNLSCEANVKNNTFNSWGVNVELDGAAIRGNYDASGNGNLVLENNNYVLEQQNDIVYVDVDGFSGEAK